MKIREIFILKRAIIRDIFFLQNFTIIFHLCHKPYKFHLSFKNYQIISYLLGHIISAQISLTMEKDLGLIDNLIENGQYQKIIQWLKNNIHNYGRSLNAMQLVKEVTKSELSSEFFIKYLKRKISDFC